MPALAKPSPFDLQVEKPQIDEHESNKPGPQFLKASTAYNQLSEYGIEVGETDVEAQKQFNVRAVTVGSRAANWGVLAGDKIVSVHGTQRALILTVQRGGKVYAINLSQERDLHGTEAASSQERQPQANLTQGLPPGLGQIAGKYRGTISFGGDITTEIKFTPQGIPYGTYNQNTNDGFYIGDLSQGAVNGNQVSFMWHDKFGFGNVTLLFSPDMNSFHGVWSSNTTNILRQWTGVRQ